MHRPLLLIAGGLAIVALDFRVEALDLLPDPLGWAFVAIGAGVLSLRPVAWLAWATVLLSVADAYLPYRRVLLDPESGEIVERCTSLLGCSEVVHYVAASGWHLAAMAAALVGATLTLLVLALELRRRALAAGDGRGADRWALLAGGIALVWALPQAVAMGRGAVSHDGYDPVWNGSAEYLALSGLVVLITIMAELWRRGGAGWAIPRERQLASRWGSHR